MKIEIRGLVAGGGGCRMKITGFRNYLGWPKSSFGCYHKMFWKNPNELFGQPNTRGEAGLRGLVMVLYIKEEGESKMTLIFKEKQAGRKNSNPILHMLHLGCLRVFREEMSKRQLGMQV